jgi:hypothetical protein
MQKPCLITKSTGFGDFFQKYHVGLRVEPTVDGIAVGLRHFAEITSEELKEVGTQSRQAVLQEFRWERTAQLLCQAYQQHTNGC